VDEVLEDGLYFLQIRVQAARSFSCHRAVVASAPRAAARSGFQRWLMRAPRFWCELVTWALCAQGHLPVQNRFPLLSNML